MSRPEVGLRRLPYVQVDARRIFVVGGDLWAVEGPPAAVRAWAAGRPLAEVVRRDGEGLVYVRGVRPEPGEGLTVHACGWPDGTDQIPARALILERRLVVVLAPGSDESAALVRLGLPVVERHGDRGFILDTGPDPLAALAESLRCAADPAVAGCNPVIRFPRFPRRP